jgi:hypothetical protein
MAEFKLGRIRFVWKDQWAAGTTYYKDDVVRLGGRTFICTVGHTAAVDFYTDLDFSPSKWNQMGDGQEWRGEWSPATSYAINDLVKYGGIVYIANNNHTSAATVSLGLEPNIGDWDEFSQGVDWKNAWTVSTRYKKNDLVKYGGYTYICITGHTSASTTALGLEANQASWAAFNQGIEYKSTWTTGTRYKLNDVVKYGAGLWICIDDHTAAAAFLTDSAASRWESFVEGIEFESEWDNGTLYQPGDLVVYGGNQYISKTFHTGSSPGANDSSVNWQIFTEGFKYQAAWNSGTTYKVGEVVSVNGYTYLAITENNNQEPPNLSYWRQLNSGVSWRGEWTNSTAYKLGDAVRFGANTYICVLGHTSNDDDSTTTGDLTRSPANDITGTFWNVLTIGSETSVLTAQGDMVYFGGAGPTRLPIGQEGQVLRSTGTIPEWVSLGQVDHLYYVATHGTDAPYPIHGGTLDKPWKTIRYACEQIDRGPINPNTQHLLELNRAFIQREVSAWIRAQITANTAPFTTSFDYDEYKCERDVGFIVDRLIWDLGHGGNLKIRAAAQSLLGVLDEGPFSAAEEDQPYATLASESDEGVAAYNYMLEVVEAVLNNSAPTTIYQTALADSTAIVTQYINTDYVAEPGVLTEITSLVGIITDALTTLDSASIPERSVPNNLIQVKAGRYREVLPIIVPAETCVLGDEVRSTNAGPVGSLISRDDAKYSIGALGRLETVVGQIILGSNVTESTGNTLTQNAQFPFASSVEEIAIKQLVRTIQHRIDFSVGTMALESSTDPTGYNVGYLTGFGAARKLLKENKEFIKAEIIAFIAVTYPNVKYSKTVCRRDVGYIIDAMVYDLTYGGSTQSLAAGLAYFDGVGSTLMIDSTELTATIASYNRLKSVMQSIIGNTPFTPSTGNTATQWTDSVNLTGGSAASSFIGANIDIITAILTGGSTTFRPRLTVTSITGTDTLNTSASHGLAAGDLIVPRTTAYGLTADVRYYVIASGLTGTAFKVSTSYAGSAVTGLTNGSGLTYIVDTEDRPIATDGVSSTTALITAYTALSAAAGTIVTDMTSFITANYPTLSYNSAKCQRDARIILDAVGYDFMFNSNFQTIKAAYAYLRSSASEVYSLNQKAATRAAFSYVKTQAKANVGGDATAQARIEALMTTLDDIIYGATDEGSICQTDLRAADYARLQLERNRDYIVAEITAYGAATYTTTVTAATAATDVFTCSSTSWMQRNAPIRFTGTTFGGISTSTTYYIQNVVSATTFKIATTRDSNTAFDIATDASGSMTVSLYYVTGSCERDVNEYLDALKFDTQYPGNYRSRLAARYYANAVNGSLEENMFLVRNGTGVRNMTLEGLTGDLLAPNAYGTSRVSAGAYVSLDPGWGPDDFRTWIISRSCYVQNVTTFGYAAIGQKIDGSLHNGGNDSIVSNDFTQVISDGIGAWVTNNGRAELVSVFSYYAHIGYLSENGGRIRGTNGNNSYGDFGSVAEGFDATEVVNTAVVNNKAFKATVGAVNTDSDKMYNFEFDNAGSEYTEATWLIVGPGNFGDVEADEFRDDAVFEVRMLDNIDDSTAAPEADGNLGGFGYVSASNTAQGGNTTSITLAATDESISTAYIGMRITITGGSGVGNFAIIDTYNSGTKVAGVVKETTGAAGWDHTVSGTTIVAPDSSSTYLIEPKVTFSAPPTFASTSNATGLSSATWKDVAYGNLSNTYVGLTGTYSGTGGTGATFTVLKYATKYFPSILAAGTGYTRLDTITIPGTSLGGGTTTNDLVITITSVNSVTGAIQAIDYEGFARGGRFVAISTTQVGATSEDGVTWTSSATLLPASATWSAIAHGLFDDGSTNEKVSRFVAVASAGAGNRAAYSADGLSWTSVSAVTSAAWVDVAYGESRFVAIASDSTTVRVSLDGEVWDNTGTLSATGYTALAYGMGLFVAVKSGSRAVNYSSTGLSTWTEEATGLPSTAAWTDITWGNGRFVAIAGGGSTAAAYSLDGVTWTAATLPAGTWTKVAYGQSVFLAVSTTTAAAVSEDGVTWTSKTMDTASGGFASAVFGNPNRSGKFAAIGSGGGSASQVSNYTTQGARARGRAYLSSEKITIIRITEPGSGYSSAPTLTIVDPNNVYEAPTSVRIGKGALANPSFKNRGVGYTTSSAELDAGDGYADLFQNGNFVAVKQITARPVAGSNVVFAGYPTTYKLVNIVTFIGEFAGDFTAFYQISPPFKISENLPDATAITTRIRYSQVRLTGHDFLDIGTGNFTETNYPGTPTQTPIQANEAFEAGGGRVFFTSTDQDGNFRVGDLFTIEQSTGVATLNADAFNISGLQELSLGEVTLGGGSASITEFSTDPFFTANSDSVIPTQRAIKAYISSQIGGGGASLVVNSITAGVIVISTNIITTTSNETININATVDFQGPVTGIPLALNYFLT